MAPLNPQPTTEPTVVDAVLLPVTGVTETYAVVPADDGGAWLLPAYRFTFDDGSSRSVVAVPDRRGSTRPAPRPRSVRPRRLRHRPFVGLPEEQAAARAAAQGQAYRVAERDGVAQLLTADYSPDRVNVAIGKAPSPPGRLTARARRSGGRPAAG